MYGARGRGNTRRSTSVGDENMVMRLSRCLFGIVALALATQVHAQRSTSVVSGFVFDSVTHAPLAGAAVQVASRDSANLLFAVRTDDK